MADQIEPDEIPDSGLGVNGRAFLIGGFAVFLLIAAVALLMIVGPSPGRVDPSFWGTPTPTPRPGALPF